MKRVLFPFIPLYDALILKQRWWHRLAVVVFFLSFLVAIGMTAVITWSKLSVSLSEDDRHEVIVNSYHELESPEDRSTGVDFDFVQPVLKETETANKAKQNFDWSKYPTSGDKPVDCYDGEGNLLPDEAAAFKGFTTGCAPGQTSKPKTERIHVAKARLQYVEQAEACQKKVVAEYANGDVELYRRKMSDCLVPDVRAGHREETADEKTEVFGDVFDKLAFKRDMETNPKTMKVQVPKVGVIAFPASVGESKVTRVCKTLYDRVTAAERKARAKTIAYALTVLGVLFYIPQVGYRLLLYVAFGGGHVGGK